MNQRPRRRGISTFLTEPEAQRLRVAMLTRRAWGAWLGGFSWHHYATLTFASPPSPPNAVRLFRTWVRRLEQRAQEKVFWFYALERGGAGLRHLHALVSGTYQLPAASVAATWNGGRAAAEVYDPRRGASYYVTKDITSDDVEYDVNLPPRLPTTDVDRPSPTGGSSAQRVQPAHERKEIP